VALVAMKALLRRPEGLARRITGTRLRPLLVS
jgi:hypothetical protein